MEKIRKLWDEMREGISMLADSPGLRALPTKIHPSTDHS